MRWVGCLVLGLGSEAFCKGVAGWWYEGGGGLGRGVEMGRVSFEVVVDKGGWHNGFVLVLWGWEVSGRCGLRERCRGKYTA